MKSVDKTDDCVELVKVGKENEVRSRNEKKPETGKGRPHIDFLLCTNIFIFLQRNCILLLA